MSKWAEDNDPKVRRFASEGCRPRLPWAMAIPRFKKDPTPILEVLEKLKYDDSEDVRRSVANNLNDISKDNPHIAISVCKRWLGQAKETDNLLKHACRGLLKSGNMEVLAMFGYSDPANIHIDNFALKPHKLMIGHTLGFAFDLTIKEKCKVRFEYAVYYLKARGQYSKKVFKITEDEYKQGTYRISRRQSFAERTTRRHYPGEHYISIIANGEEKHKASFWIDQVV